jgi:hypothetical protein
MERNLTSRIWALQPAASVRKSQEGVHAEMTGLLGPLSLLLWAILFAHGMGVNMVSPFNCYLLSPFSFIRRACITRFKLYNL